MFIKLRQRLAANGPATVVAVIALSVALCGGAFAATASKTKKKGGVVITKLSQIKPSVRKQLEGAAGPAGPAGPIGPAGLAGAKGDTGLQGPAGAAGAKGDPGTSGAAGANGEDVVVTQIATGIARCSERGGVEVRLKNQAAGTGKDVCNGAAGAPGADGDPGPEGSPWTAGGTLPPGATEVGAWSFQASPDQTEGTERIFTPVSFSIALPVDVLLSVLEHPENQIHFVAVGQEPPACLEGSPLAPKAAPGHVCIYESASGIVNSSFLGITIAPGLSEGVGTAGAYLEFAQNTDPAKVASGAGSIAVTGCSESLPVGDPNKCPTA
jgi:hypothetical protein